MDENPDKKEVSEKSEKAATKQKKSPPATVRKVWRGEYMVFAVIFLVLAGGGIYFFQQINKSQQLAIQIRHETESMQADIGRQISRLNGNITKLASEQDALKRTLSDITRQQPRINEDWALSEIEYLLIIASHRLLLESDVKTALAAMEAASQRLQSLSSPDLIPVREQLTADINRLRAVNQPETTGLAIYLADLVERAGNLPVRKPVITSSENGNNQQVNENEPSSWRNALGVLWQELKSLVVIRKSGEIRQALLLPDEEYFLRQNLRLELENARFAVLRRDTENLHTSIVILLDWLKRYYETSDAAVSNIMDTLTEMSSLELQPELPDISSSLETLRAYMRQQ